MARLSEIPFGNSLTGLQLTPAQRPRQLNRLARSLTVTGYASVRAYGTTNLKSSKAQHLACVCHPPKSAPILLRGGTFGGITHLKRRKTLQAFLVYSTPRKTATAMQGDPSSPAFSQGRRGEGSVALSSFWI